MKKKYLGAYFVAAFIFVLLSSHAVYANARIDTSRAADGVIFYEFTGDLSQTVIRAFYSKDGVQKHAVMSSSPTAMPLTMGTGTYTARVLQIMPDGTGRPIVSEEVTVRAINEEVMFTISNLNVDFAVSTVAIPYFEELIKEINDVVNTIYDYVINNFTYDHGFADRVRAGLVPGSYLPVIDDFFEARKGVCFHYSALLAGALRNKGIPTKLVKGFTRQLGEERHAWNEILIDGTWVIVDATFDATLVENNRRPIFARPVADYMGTEFW
jgi:transglutaminase-like putative cysteine protease